MSSETAGMRASAQAQPNIALAKYWGKRETALNLPAVGSFSITLDSLHTRTSVHFDPDLEADLFVLDGREEPGQTKRVSACLDLLRERAGTITRARVTSHNNFPTAAGLASSASGFAALVVAANEALDLGLSDRELSAFARRGSGSAARSIYGGFVEMDPGARPDGEDAVAQEFQAADFWQLEVVIAITSGAVKPVGSTEGMLRTAATSPYYRDWVASSGADVDEARQAVQARDFERLALVAEYSCLKMHGLAMSARPGLLYWNGASMECLHTVRAMRNAGSAVFFTVDAGPQVKAVCLPDSAAGVAETLGEIPGVRQVLRCGLGAGARVTEPRR